MTYVVAMEVPGKWKSYFVGFYKNCCSGDWSGHYDKLALCVEIMSRDRAEDVAQVLRGNGTGGGVVTVEGVHV